MSQNLQNVVKFQKFQFENLVDFEKCCQTHIFLQKSEPIQPKSSNILPKFCQPTLSGSPARGAPRPTWAAREPSRRSRPRWGSFRSPPRSLALPRLVDTLFCNVCQVLGGSFSAVPKPIFASKHSFCCIVQDLHGLRTSAPLQTQHFINISLKY